MSVLAFFGARRRMSSRPWEASSRYRCKLFNGGALLALRFTGIFATGNTPQDLLRLGPSRLGRPRCPVLADCEAALAPIFAAKHHYVGHRLAALAAGAEPLHASVPDLFPGLQGSDFTKAKPACRKSSPS